MMYMTVHLLSLHLHIGSKFAVLYSTKTCLLKHEIALYTESTESFCGSQMPYTPFITYTFYYIFGNYYTDIHILYLVCCILIIYVYFMS